MSTQYTLITGASGFLGHYLINQLQSSRIIIGIYNTVPNNLSFIDNEKIDLTDFNQVELLFKKYLISEIFHCAAITNPDFCIQYPDLSHKVNVEVAEELSILSCTKSIPLNPVFEIFEELLLNSTFDKFVWK